MAVVISKYKKEYVVKSYEVDCHGFLRVLTLMNWLQDAAVENAEYLGFGFEACQRHNLAWVGSNYVVEIKRWPKLDETVVIETWPAEEKLWGAVRDFHVRDESGNVIVAASSQWVLINHQLMRPVILRKYFSEYNFLAERAIVTDFPKIDVSELSGMKEEFKVRFDDIDLNNHVNNAIYPLWASECVDKEFRLHHRVKKIELCFKKGALYGERVEVNSVLRNNKSTHLITEHNGNTELAVCSFEWDDITS